MTKMAEELGKIGMSAGPGVSCDARPSIDSGDNVGKKKRRTPQFKRTKPVALEQLVVAYGHKKAGEMIGMSGSGLATAISRDDVSVPVERLAEMLLLNEGKQVVVPKERLVVARVPAAKAEVVLTFMKALGIKTMDFVP